MIDPSAGELRSLLQTLEFSLGITLIGSDPECDLRLHGRHIEPLHACLVAKPDGVVLYDISFGDVTVNGSPIEGATRLRDRDRVEIGGERFVFATWSSRAPVYKNGGKNGVKVPRAQPGQVVTRSESRRRVGG